MNSRILQGRYLLQHEIGSGGMGAVHLGVSIGEAGFRRRVAVKRLRACYAHDPRLRAFFVDEARLAGQVEHANVVATLDVVSEGGELFLVMDYVAGETLSALFRDAGRTPAPIAVALLVDALQGLHAIHEARGRDGKPLGLVHRDVSPHNVMAGLDGVGYVLDFGIARPSSDIDETRNEDAGGKLAYMAPETLLYGEVTRRGDVYAAGLVLWEALVGRRFRAGSSAADLIMQAHRNDVTAPSGEASHLPLGLDEVVLKACSRAPEDRYGSAFEMAAALEAACPPATRTSVGAWVRELAGEVIERRAACDVHAAATVMPPASLDHLTVLAPGGQEESFLKVPAPLPYESVSPEPYRRAMKVVARHADAPMSLPQLLASARSTKVSSRPADAGRSSLPAAAASEWPLAALSATFATPAVLSGPPPSAALLPNPFAMPGLLSGPLPAAESALTLGLSIESSVPPGHGVLPALPVGTMTGALPTGPITGAVFPANPATTAGPALPVGSATTAGPALPALPGGAAATATVANKTAAMAAPAALATGSLALSAARKSMPTRLAASLAALKAVVVQEQRREIDSLSGLQYGAGPSAAEATAHAPTLDSLGRKPTAVADAPRSRAFGVTAAALAVAAMASFLVGKGSGVGGETRSAAQGSRTSNETLVESAPRVDLSPMGRELRAPSDGAARAAATPPPEPAAPPASTITSIASPAPTAAAAPAPIVASSAAPTPGAQGSARGVISMGAAVVAPSGTSAAKRQAAVGKPFSDECDPPVFIDSNGNRHLKPACTKRDD